MSDIKPKSANDVLNLYDQGIRTFLELDIPDGEDFSGVNLEGATFDQCWLSIANFQKARLKDAAFLNCNVKCSDFGDADLRNAKFYGSAVEAINLKGANLDGVSFEGAWLYGCELGKEELPTG
jgi:uncharacterized protein YjbI with pentapeptide repeats